MSDYNIFKVLKLERKETIHSAMIAAIASHDSQSRKAFFQMLKEKAFEKEINCLMDSIDFDSDKDGHWINTEVVLEKARKKEDWGRADIWIGTNKKDGTQPPYRLIIENKIDADFQYRQLRKYFRYLNEPLRQFAGLFVLCVRNDEDFKRKAESAAEKFNHETTPIVKDKPTDYAIITYRDIIHWLEKVIKGTEEGSFMTAVKQYKKILDDFYPKEKTG